MKLNFILVIFFFESCVSVKCPTDLRSIPLNRNGGLAGPWYLMRKTPSSIYDDKMCIVQFYRDYEFKINELLDLYTDKQTGEKEKKTLATIEVHSNNTGHMTAIYPSGATVTMHFVYGGDFELSAGIVACMKSFLSTRRYALILSKFANPTEQQLQPAYQKLAEYGFSKDSFVEGFSLDECADPFTNPPDPVTPAN